jgi:hypothetical protein
MSIGKKIAVTTLLVGATFMTAFTNASEDQPSTPDNTEPVETVSPMEAAKSAAKKKIEDTMSQGMVGKSDTQGGLTRKFFKDPDQLKAFLGECKKDGGQAISPPTTVASNTFMGLCIRK